MKKSTKVFSSLVLVAAMGSMFAISVASANEAVDDRGGKLGEFQYLNNQSEDCEIRMGEHAKGRMGEASGLMHEEMEIVLEEGDYDAFVILLEGSDSRMSDLLLEVINEDNFDLFIDLHEARDAEDFETAHEIASELGLGGPNNGRGGRHFGVNTDDAEA